MGFRQESNSSGLVEPEILSSDARRIHVRLRRGECQIIGNFGSETPPFYGGFTLELKGQSRKPSGRRSTLKTRLRGFRPEKLGRVKSLSNKYKKRLAGNVPWDTRNRASEMGRKSVDSV